MGTWFKANATIVLVIGEAVTLGVVTVIGFASHGTLLDSGPRVLATLIPVLFSWFLIATFLGAYEGNNRSDYHQLWRIVISGIYASPLAAWMRGMILNAPIIPIFVLVLGATSILGLIIWRVVYILLLKWVSE